MGTKRGVRQGRLQSGECSGTDLIGKGAARAAAPPRAAWAQVEARSVAFRRVQQIDWQGTARAGAPPRAAWAAGGANRPVAVGMAP